VIHGPKPAQLESGRLLGGDGLNGNNLSKTGGIVQYHARYRDGCETASPRLRFALQKDNAAVIRIDRRKPGFYQHLRFANRSM